MSLTEEELDWLWGFAPHADTTPRFGRKDWEKWFHHSSPIRGILCTVRLARGAGGIPFKDARDLIEVGFRWGREEAIE